MHTLRISDGIRICISLLTVLLLFNCEENSANLEENDDLTPLAVISPNADQSITVNEAYQYAVHNNGLDATITDVGAGDGEFKAPSLRNIEVTGPYMHDGRFATLEEVVEHYNSGVQNNGELSQRLRNNNGTPNRLNLTQAEKDALVAFMKTLTDETFLSAEKFSSPFPD